MRLSAFTERGPCRFELSVGKGAARAVVFASTDLLRDMEEDVGRQLRGVAALPGIAGPALAMPDAHVGYGFPIGGVAAFDAHEGVVCAGGVGFDIACGVRCLRTGLSVADVLGAQLELADALFAAVPSGVGSTGGIRLSARELDAMLAGGAAWAVKQGYGSTTDLDWMEERGRMPRADPVAVSDTAKQRMRDQLGTLGSGNHYLEIQAVEEVFDARAADACGIAPGDAVLSIHCGSRGLGHQIGKDYMALMLDDAARAGTLPPDRELANAPADSNLGRAYLAAMRAGVNCALANRQAITHLAREAFSRVLPGARLGLIYDVSHNTCKLERHRVDGRERDLLVHRKGATRAWGPGHPGLPARYAETGQPAFIGGSMGAPSYILAGEAGNEGLSLGSVCHGAGRAMSRARAKKAFRGGQVLEELRGRGILVRTASMRGAAEEAPGAYKNIEAVVDATCCAGLARRVARLAPLICVKG
ncbi:RtcB family protein [Desulfocurvus sp. DL9XJH121]